MAKIINQKFGENWAYYNGDCIHVMSNLPSDSIDFGVHSPPFAQLYIYSDSIADMGNASSDEEFFQGYEFTLRELFRIIKDGSYHAIHCKDLMAYMSNHGYAGQKDFPGQIIQLAELIGWTLQRFITIWKNPVTEMQKTKSYGLLHKSFAERAEVVRVGAPDIVLVFRKQKEQGGYDDTESMPFLPLSVIDRVKHIWSMPGDTSRQLSIHTQSLSAYTPETIDNLSKHTDPGRLVFVHCSLLPRRNKSGEIIGYFDMASEIIRRFEAQGSWKFHTRITLTNGTSLIGFRNWTDELKRNYKDLNGQVTHELAPPKGALYHEFVRYENEYEHEVEDIIHLAMNKSPDERTELENRLISIKGKSEIIKTNYEDKGGLKHHDYIGNDPPRNWHDTGYYSIFVWQKYASPVWFDLEGLPKTHPDCWMDIEQTDVLNYRVAKDKDDEKHICPLQLGLIKKIILEYSEPGEVIFSPYGGISSEGYTAVRLRRKAILAELKSSYFEQGVRYMRECEKSNLQRSLLEGDE